MAKARGLSEEGVTAYHWCSSYRLPVQTVTGDIQVGCHQFHNLPFRCSHLTQCPTLHNDASLRHSGNMQLSGLKALCCRPLQAACSFKSLLKICWRSDAWRSHL